MAKRRQNGEGTIYQRANGLWVCEITIGFDENGKRKKKVISSMNLDDLKRKMNVQKVNIDNGIMPTTESLTVNEWLKQWLSAYVEGKVKTTTYDNYMYAYEKHIKHRLGGFKLNKVTPLIIQAFVNDMDKEGYSLSTIKKPYIVLNQCFKKAIINELMTRNPCTDIEFPKSKARKVIAMTADEQDIFEKACEGATYGNMFLFALQTGLRVSELLALTWDNVDMENHTIRIEQIIVQTVDRTDSELNSKLEVSTPKTDAGKRTVPLSNKAYEILKQQIGQDAVLCFPSNVGTVINRRNMKRGLKKVTDTCPGIKTHVTMHVLRHTFATRLLEKGANIKAVSEILGHKSIQITLDTYSHVLSDFKAETIALLN